MYKKSNGFTVAELVSVILVLTILVVCIAPFLIRSTSAVLRKTRAAADAASLRSTITNVTAELVDGKSMSDIASSMEKGNCETDPNANLWLNYAKPVSLHAYFVDGEKYYSIDYLSQIALNGSSELEPKAPLTLGFWYEAGAEN